MNSRTLLTSSLLLTLCLTACADAGSPSSAAGPDSWGKADGDEGETEPPPEVAGTYAVSVRSVVDAVDDAGESDQWVTGMVGLAVVEQDGAELSIVIRTCSVDLPPAGDHRPTVSDEVVEHLDPVVATGVAYVDANGAASLATDPAALLLGVDLEDPLGEDVPDDRDDPRVVDQDGDGHPGISVDVSIFTVFAAARVLFGLVGEVDEEGSIAGECDLSLDFSILGDSIPFYDAREAAAEAAGDYSVVDQRDSFRMTPLDTPSCEAALAAQ